MATTETPNVPTGPLAEVLAPWLTRQRWFAGKGTAGAADVTLAGGTTLAEDRCGASVRLHLVDAAGTLYQVPLTHHRSPVPELAHALVGMVTDDGADDGADGRWVYDAPHDPLYLHTLLRLMNRGEDVGEGAVRLSGVRQQDGVPIDEQAPGSVLRGEQSNTSIVVAPDAPTPLIVKVFRVIAHGDNPDVVVASALATAGCERVPHPAGWVEGDWWAGGSQRHGHLAFAVEFLAGSEDAWRVAARAVAAGESFAGPARELGAATAEVHERLAETLPTRVAGHADLARLSDGLLARLEWAVGEVPDLADVAAAARARIARASRGGTGGAPVLLQRIHGDYHLGQVLHAPGRGWVLLDFEGEPLRPLAERARPDLALRDVAGMLRSFDYAAGHAVVTHPGDAPLAEAARAWAAEARVAFLTGYAERAGLDLAEHADLMAALEVDKALYEVVYESRNRPDWVVIPASAVRRLLGA